MTTITLPRAVVEQALEALSLALSDVNWRADSPTQPVIHKAHAALRAALAQQDEPAQEPAYKVKVAGRWHEAEPLAAAFNLPDGEHLLYTAPPQRRPLTEEEIMHIGMTHQSLRQVVRAVERAHGIT